MQHNFLRSCIWLNFGMVHKSKKRVLFLPLTTYMRLPSSGQNIEPTKNKVKKNKWKFSCYWINSVTWQYQPCAWPCTYDKNGLIFSVRYLYFGKRNPIFLAKSQYWQMTSLIKNFALKSLHLICAAKVSLNVSPSRISTAVWTTSWPQEAITIPVASNFLYLVETSLAARNWEFPHLLLIVFFPGGLTRLISSLTFFAFSLETISLSPNQALPFFLKFDYKNVIFLSSEKFLLKSTTHFLSVYLLTHLWHPSQCKPSGHGLPNLSVQALQIVFLFPFTRPTGNWSIRKACSLY